MGDQYWLRGNNASFWTITDISCSWEVSQGLSARVIAGLSAQEACPLAEIFPHLMPCCIYLYLLLLSAIFLVFSVFCVTQETMEMLGWCSFCFWVFWGFFFSFFLSFKRPCGIQHWCRLMLLCLTLVRVSVFKSHSTFQQFSTFYSLSGKKKKRLWWDSRFSSYSKNHRTT